MKLFSATPGELLAGMARLLYCDMLLPRAVCLLAIAQKLYELAAGPLTSFTIATDKLPPALLTELLHIMESPDCMLEGYIRPGCVELTLDILLAGGLASDR